MSLTVKRSLPTLGALGILGPLGTDIFLPALPVMAIWFASPPTSVQLSLGSISLGMAIGQLFGGIIADRFGRRKLMVLGAGLAAVSAFASAVAPSVFALIAVTFFLGLGASIGMVVGRAVISDISEGVEARKAFAVLGSLTGIGAIAAPLLGTVLLSVWGWQATFVTLGILATLCVVAVLIEIPETLHKDDRHTIKLSEYPGLMWGILKNKTYLLNSAILWFGFAMGFGYISASSFIVQVILGWSAAGYGITFAINAVSMALVGFGTGVWAHKYPARKLLGASVVLQWAAASLLFFSLLTSNYSPFLLLPGMWALAVSMGFVFGPATGNAMAEMQGRSGSALALMGSIQFVFGGIAAPMVGIAGDHSTLPLTVLTLVGVTAISAIFFFGRRYIR